MGVLPLVKMAVAGPLIYHFLTGVRHIVRVPRSSSSSSSSAVSFVHAHLLWPRCVLFMWQCWDHLVAHNLEAGRLSSYAIIAIAGASTLGLAFVDF